MSAHPAVPTNLCVSRASADGLRLGVESPMGLVWYYSSTNPIMSELGRSTISCLLEHADELIQLTIRRFAAIALLDKLNGLRIARRLLHNPLDTALFDDCAVFRPVSEAFRFGGPLVVRIVGHGF